MKKSTLTLFYSILIATALSAQDLTIRFIGNCAFEISDGEKTVFSDFPYKSGAFGYMHYNFKEVQPTGDVLCLITHNHQDHYLGDLMKNDWTIAAPPGIPIPSGIGQVEWGKEMAWKDIAITPIETPHTPEHHSYVIEWLETTLYFTGDTETTAFLPKDIVDVLFITPWLAETAKQEGVPLMAHQVVIYHHRKNQKPDCDKCLVPDQGDVLVVP